MTPTKTQKTRECGRGCTPLPRRSPSRLALMAMERVLFVALCAVGLFALAVLGSLTVDLIWNFPQ
jgi:hypothetical protein